MYFAFLEFANRADYLKDLDNNWTDIAPYLLDFANTISRGAQEQIAQKIRWHYFGNKHINQSTIEILIKLVGDRLFFYDTENTVRLQAGQSPVYYYLYGYRATDSFSNFLSNSSTNFGKY